VIADDAARPVVPVTTTVRIPRWLARGGLALFALVGAVQLVLVLRESPWVWHDFAQDHIAIQEAVAGRNPYAAQNGRIGELFDIPPPPDKEPAYSFHPPSTLAFFLPLAPLPYRAAFVAWDLINLACLWAIVHLTARGIGRPIGPATSVAIAIGLVGVWPLRENFVEGQLNVPVAAGLVGYWYALRTGRTGAAGVALATAVALKPLAGLFVLYAIWRRQWRAVIFGAVALGLLSIVGSLLAGAEGVRDYVVTAYPLHAGLWPGYPDNASPQGFFTRIFGPNPWKRPIYPIAQVATVATLLSWAVVVGLLFSRLGRRPSSGERLNVEFAALGATMLLVTPIIWPHYYVVLVAPLAILIPVLWRQRAWHWLAILAVAVLILWIPRNEWVPRGMGNVQLPALLAVYVVALRQLWRREDPADVPLTGPAAG
jgi:hypothetical protein